MTRTTIFHIWYFLASLCLITINISLRVYDHIRAKTERGIELAEKGELDPYEVLHYQIETGQAREIAFDIHLYTFCASIILAEIVIIAVIDFHKKDELKELEKELEAHKKEFKELRKKLEARKKEYEEQLRREAELTAENEKIKQRIQENKIAIFLYKFFLTIRKMEARSYHSFTKEDNFNRTVLLLHTLRNDIYIATIDELVDIALYLEYNDHSFTSRLMEDIPCLSRLTVIYSCLVRVGFSDKEIARIFGVERQRLVLCRLELIYRHGALDKLNKTVDQYIKEL